MRSKNLETKRPLTDKRLDSESTQKENYGGEEMDSIVQRISLENVSLEERRKEAKKPLYLVRYE
jgi:hypothetical protein